MLYEPIDPIETKCVYYFFVPVVIVLFLLFGCAVVFGFDVAFIITDLIRQSAYHFNMCE